MRSEKNYNVLKLIFLIRKSEENEEERKMVFGSSLVKL
jgi:hypothetical protein